jgi:hypothetical protein
MADLKSSREVKPSDYEVLEPHPDNSLYDHDEAASDLSSGGDDSGIIRECFS